MNDDRIKKKKGEKEDNASLKKECVAMKLKAKKKKGDNGAHTTSPIHIKYLSHVSLCYYYITWKLRMTESEYDATQISPIESY